MLSVIDKITRRAFAAPIREQESLMQMRAVGC